MKTHNQKYTRRSVKRDTANDPVRQVITRKKKTFRVKFASMKNACSVHCESILEGDVALFLEISPFVKSFRGQPRHEAYYDKHGEIHRYTPDFEVTLFNDSILDVEAKPKSKFRRRDIREKFELIAQQYTDKGRVFRIFTEEFIRVEPLFSNLKLLKYHRRVKLQSAEYRQFEVKLTEGKFSTVGDAAALLGNKKHVLDMIASGFLAADLKQHLDEGSSIWIRDITKGDENDPLRV